MKKTLALLLALVMILAVCVACGDKDEAPAAEAPAAETPAAEAPAAPDAAAPGAAAPAEEAAVGEPSEEPTGEPVAELFPADGYSKDLDGYKQYAIDALKSDEHAPPEIVDSTIEAIEVITDGSDATFDMMIRQGRILSYDEFIG